MKSKLTDKQIDLLWKLAAFWGLKYFYPIPPTAGDIRARKLIIKERERYMHDVITDQLKGLK